MKSFWGFFLKINSPLRWGANGEDGVNGRDGTNGINGINGIDGNYGRDGINGNYGRGGGSYYFSSWKMGWLVFCSFE